MPPTPKVPKLSIKTSTPNRKTISKEAGSGQKQTPNSRTKLTELFQNSKDPQDRFDRTVGTVDMYGSIDGDLTLRITIEKLRQLEKEKVNSRDYIANNLTATDGYLELVGWSKGKYIPNSFYDSLFNPNLKIRRLALRGRGSWTTCNCPKEQSKFGEQIDSICSENITHLEHLYIFRTFSISPCALLDLISRSPNLKTFRFYGDLERSLVDHYSAFDSVRFISSLEALYWPWCNRRYHLPTLRTLVSRQDQIITFYCDAESTCDFISSDRLPNMRYLSLNLNEHWNYHVPEDAFEAIVQNDSLTNEEKEAKLIKKKERKCRKLMKTLPNRIEKLIYLTQLDMVEALEIRTYDITFQDDEDDEQKNAQIIKQYETYQLKFWECVAKMRSLKYLAAYGAWDLDKVARELAKHGLQIEYFRTNLMPVSLMIGIRESSDENQPLDPDEEKKTLKLNLIDSTRHLVKLAKLKSLHFSCFEFLADLHTDTQVALKDVSDLIWRIDCRVYVTKVVDDVLNQILRRGNQSGRSYRIKLSVEPEDPSKAKFIIETVQKFSTTTIKDRLHILVQSECKQRYGKANYKTMSLWGLEQAGGRDRAVFEQLKAAWNTYDEQFRPIDRFV